MWITWSQQELAILNSQIPPKYTIEITNSRDHLYSSYLDKWISFTMDISYFRLEICCTLRQQLNGTASSSVPLYRISYFHTEHYNSVLELFSWYIRNEAWLNLIWKYINGKLFAVYWPPAGAAPPWPPDLSAGPWRPLVLDPCISSTQSAQEWNMEPWILDFNKKFFFLNS